MKLGMQFMLLNVVVAVEFQREKYFHLTTILHCEGNRELGNMGNRKMS